MEKKRDLLIIGGILILCLFVIILALIKWAAPSSKEAEEKKSAGEVSKTSAAENLPAAADTLQPIVPLPAAAGTLQPVVPPTPTLPPPTPSPTMIASNLPPCIQRNPTGTEALVTKVIDDDEIEVVIEGKNYTVRYIGMDTPESDAKEATDKNKELVSGKKVILYKDVSEMDQYDRLVRYVLVDEVFVNDELVRSGYANAVSFPPDIACDGMLAEAQKEAQANLVGLWAVDAGTPSEIITPQTTEASDQVVITNIFFKGVAAQVESDEYAEITNKGDSSVQLNGWRLKASAKGQEFIFPKYELLPGQSCRIYTNEVHPESCGFSFHNPQALWENSADCGYLFNAEGEEASLYCYK